MTATATCKVELLIGCLVCNLTLRVVDIGCHCTTSNRFASLEVMHIVPLAGKGGLLRYARNDE